MIINDYALLNKKPIKNMAITKHREHGVSWGLGEAGYDIRIKQEIQFVPDMRGSMRVNVVERDQAGNVLRAGVSGGRFIIASAIEEFDMPTDLVGIVHDKSTWARKGLSVFNTVIEPGWKGFLTLELVYQGSEGLIIPAGAGIAQVLFHETAVHTAYEGKYQNQEDNPVHARS